jgi:fructose-1,6-bisphosphatase I
VYGFTLDPTIGAFVLSHEQMKMPAKGKYYSCNEANINLFPEHYRAYIQELRSPAEGAGYSSRYIGSLVADFHRTLLKGGVFLYPPTESHPNGKLRLLYEANPLALIAEQAGGIATSGEEPILNIIPRGIHQRTPLVIGGRSELEAFSALAPATRCEVPA